MMVYSSTKDWRMARARQKSNGRRLPSAGARCRKRKTESRRKGSDRTSFEAVLDGDPASFVIGPRMALEFL